MHKIVKFLIPLLLIDGALADTSNMLEIPRHLPQPNSGSYLLKNFQDKNSSVIELTLDHELQSKLTAFVKNQGNHIAALIVAEVETGNIIAMVQGKNPTYWGSKEHATLHTGFPAASLFKFASTIASLETLNLNPRKATGLRGGCARVNPSGTWLKDQSPVPNFRMSLKRAFALSCNGYYAQLGIKELGMGPILHFAEKLGWRKKIPSDFQIPVSPMQVPAPSTSSIATVGKFAAGFGLVGISAVHSAWQMLAIANDGNPIPIRITKNLKPNFPPLAPIFSQKTAEKLREVMRPTTINGTAAYAFRSRRYRRYKHLIGGKTGTLSGKTPKGLTTWFAGMMPIKNPKIVVSAVAVVGDKWLVKGPHIAAEAFRTWDKINRKREKVVKGKRQHSKSTLR